MQGIKKGSEIELLVEKLAFGGKAVSRVDGFVVFLEHALPGELVRARITVKKRQFAEGRVIEVLSRPKEYTEPFCRHFGCCGGCRWQDLPYEEQLRWKRLHVLESLQHLAGVDDAVVAPTFPSPNRLHYRNKMEFTFTDRRWLLPEEIADQEIRYGKNFALGLHVRGFFDKIFNIEECFLESPQAVEILKETRDWCEKSGLPPYSIREQRGFWRFLVVREGKRTGQTLIHMLTSDAPEGEKTVNALSKRLAELFPGIITFVHTVSTSKAQVATGEKSRTVFGPGYIEELLGERRFRISANSFFQTNPSGAEKLYEAVGEMGRFTGDETVWDLYCGTGSIALTIASRVRRVLGVEVVAGAVEDAYVNCEINGVDNCRFIAGDLKNVIRDAASSSSPYGGIPDVVITDPPRAGMHPDVVKALMEMKPRRIVAVSCNPATLARDLSILLESYDIQGIQPFDLFPHTPHIECVVGLERKGE